MISSRLTDRFTISAEQLAANILGAKAVGLDCSPLLVQSGIDPDVLNNPHARIPHSAFIKFRLLLCQVLNDENAGFTEQTAPLGTLVYACRAVMASYNLKGVLNQYSHFHYLFSESVSYRFCEDGDLAYFGISVLNPSQSDHHAFLENTVQFIFSFSLWLTGRPFMLRRIDYSFSRPAYGREYADLIPCETRFDQAQTQLVFERKLLRHPIARSAAELPLFLDNHLFYLLEQNLKSGSMVERVRRLLTPNSTGPNNAEYVAGVLSISQVSLRRKLSAEGYSFTTLKQTVQQELALYYLFEKNISVLDVAPLLGFSEASAFSRAFKRWTGFSPNQYPFEARKPRGRE